MTRADTFPDVPERYRGVWRRTLLETPELRDTTTWVHWLQTARWHADLRVPAAAEIGRSAMPLAAMTPVQHLALAQQQGFFGRTEVRQRPHGDVCTWHRRLDLHPPGLTPDVGWMEFGSDDRVIETGVHGAYREVWERAPGSTGRTVVLAETSTLPCDEAGLISAAKGFLLLSGEWLMRVRPRRISWPAGTIPGDTLGMLLSRHPASATALLDFEISCGRLREGEWAIERSSLPALEGRTEPMHWQPVDDTRTEVRSASGTSVWCVLG
ncbi:MAG: hypothetical protein ACKVOX_15320 [Rhizobacter sp.]